MKLCIHCKHFTQNAFERFLIGSRFGKCRRTYEAADGLVNGHYSREDMSYCSIERKYRCGKEAQFFEAR